MLCPPGTRDNSLVGGFPYWPVVGRRIASVAHPPVSRAPIPTGEWVSVRRLSMDTTRQTGNLPTREVSLVPGGQNLISLKYQIHSLIIDTLVTGLVTMAITMIMVMYDNNDTFKVIRL